MSFLRISRQTPQTLVLARLNGTKVRPAGTSALPALLLFAAAVLAVVTGLLATTANPIFIGLFVGAIGGVALVGLPSVSLWLVLVGTLVLGGLIAQFLPALSKANWLFSMLGFLLLASTVGATLMRRPVDRVSIPWWAWLALLFPVYAGLVSVINLSSVLEFLAGFKRYFQYWGVFAGLALLTFKPGTHRNIVRFLVALALVQVVFAAYQRVVVVPQRLGLGGGVVAIDAVSGTFESSFLGGGSSSVLVFFLLTVFAFVFRLWLDGHLGGWRAFLACVLLLSPLALGETKVVVVFLPVVMLSVLALDLKKHFIRTVLLLLLGLLGTAALAALYLVISAKAGQSAQTVLENTIAYNFGNVGYHSASNLNRSTVFSFWWSQQHLGDPIGLLFGHGPGSSFSGEGALVPGKLALRFAGLAIAFTTLSSLLWDFGVLGTSLFLLFNLGAVVAVARAARRLPAGVVRSVAVAVLAGLLMSLLLFFLGNSATSLPSHSTLYMLLLGAAVLVCRQAVPGASPGQHV